MVMLDVKQSIRKQEIHLLLIVAIYEKLQDKYGQSLGALFQAECKC